MVIGMKFELGPGHEVIVKLRAKKRELELKIDAPIMKVKKYKTMFAEHHHGKGSDMEE
jgi:hypothetical protein